MSTKTEPVHETVVDPALLRARRRKWLRLAALALLFAGSLITAKATGVTDSVDIETVRAFMDAAGPWGFVLFVAVFCIGSFLHVPGFVFVAAAAVAYGQALGIAAGYAGAMASMTTTFLVVRLIGGQPLGGIERPWLRKMLDRLEQRPIATIAMLRMIFAYAAWLNYSLAMTPIKLRDYVVGTAIGLVAPTIVIVFFFEWVVATWF